ncbi:MAG TPA: YggS family pyridoxal phosphate-dependent enzyme [Chloroflexota bacterium]|nr:YggS family pyridoxal phosphate-dependent enzyme [Chloroflexota bacterium]
MTEIAARLAAVQEAIAAAERRAGREGEVTLVAVTKTVAPERIREAYDAGQRVFGENRVQEGLVKIAELAPSMSDAQWHLIGHLQTNKARRAARSFSLVASVDTVRLAEILDDAAMQAGRVLPILLEVNVAGEASKSGFAPDAIEDTVRSLLGRRHLSLDGLMTVAPLAGDPEEVRPVFRQLRDLRDRIRETLPVTGFHELSMGMTGDFPVAIEEGATMVRIGRAIFGARGETT